MKRVTIQDIADELGVSRNTVSKAINNADGLAEATREKILQKATEMGYKQFSYIQAQAADHFVIGPVEHLYTEDGFRLFGDKGDGQRPARKIVPFHAVGTQSIPQLG